MADRYMYIPLIGLFIMFGWGIPSLLTDFRHKRNLFSVSAAVILLILAAQTYRQIQVWKDSESVFSHAVEVTSNNCLAHVNLGSIYAGQSDFDRAIYHFNAAIRIKPYFADAHYNLGNTYMSKGMMKEAIFHYLEALRINPNDENVHNNLGIAFAYENDLEMAIMHFSKALSINPDYEEARMNLSYVLQNKK
jgi:tetratricopeptide (TPR) repeat protein